MGAGLPTTRLRFMRVVVTGGTGFIGGALVDELLRTGEEEIVVATRYPEKVKPRGGRVKGVQAFAGDSVSLGKAFTGADVVVHAIQFPNHPVENPRRGYTYMEVDGQGTVVAARVAKKLGVGRFVYLSGIGAGQGKTQPWYRAKDMAESAIREAGLEYGMVRPSWAYGPGDRSMNRFIFFCRNFPVVPVIGDGANKVAPLHVTDLVRCVAQAVRRDDAANRVFELGGPQELTTDEILRTILRVIGKRRPLLHQPKALVKLGTWPLQFLPTPPLSPRAVDFILQEVVFDPKPAWEFFGFPFRTLEAGLREYVRP